MQHSSTRFVTPPLHIAGAKVVSGRGRGKAIGIPTINVELASVPAKLLRGIYACRIVLEGKTYNAALHYGPRPTFNDTETMEIHVIDEVITRVPRTVDLEIVALIRRVENFNSTEALVAAMRQDIDVSRGILIRA